MSGGEIRLVITLCVADDLQGEAFGAKVTPWQQVPADEAPQWKAREAVFAVPMERCFEATFVDSAHLHIALMQKGHTNSGSPERQKPVAGGGGIAGVAPSTAMRGLSALRQSGLSALRIAEQLPVPTFPLSTGFLGESAERQNGEMIGALKIPVGRHLACGQGEFDGAQWVHLLPQKGEGHVKGSLLLELSTGQPDTPEAPVPEPPPAAALATREVSPIPSPRPSGYMSDSTESGTVSEASASSSAQHAVSSNTRTEEEEAFLKSLSAESHKVLVEMSKAKPVQAPREWRPRATVSDESQEDKVNIFNINDTGRSSSVSRLLKWSTAPLKFSNLRSAFDPGVRQQRREVRKWRQWHEVFCILNAIEQHLNEVVSGLKQAETSMRRFCQSHGSDVLREASRLPAFLCDAALYYQSEASVPSHLEDQLSRLEAVADEFRAIALEPETDESRPESEDLRVDIAVLLESLIMGSFQALAEYKKMHCRLELVAKEYEPLCRLELDNENRPATFLPLLADEETQAAVLPEQAVQWAEDFSQLVDNASMMLTALVRELQSRKSHLGSSLSELRSLLLRRAAGD